MNAHIAHGPSAVRVANDIMGRLTPLAVTLTNARAFRVLLEDLHSRDLSAIKEPHISSIHMVRAAILRAAIVTIMAALDKKGADRASIGQVIQMFEGMDLSILADRWPNSAFGTTTLSQVKSDWAALLDSPEFQDCRNFRDGAVGHTLISDIPTVTDEAYFWLHDVAEQMALRFYGICGYGEPEFLEHKSTATAKATVFWDTYWKGLAV